MPQTVGREGTQRLLHEGAQIVEVLPPKIYQQGHLPSAINIPLSKLQKEAISLLEKQKSIVVYCYDFQ